MKSKKIVLIAGALCLALLLYAFAVPPLVHLINEQGNKVDVSYDKAEVSENTLTLTVDYQSYGDMYEIGGDITVATDAAFTKPLQMLSRTPKDSQMVYTFAFTEKADTVYINPPILYMPAEIEPIKITAVSGQSIMNAKNETWFIIDSISAGKDKDRAGFYKVIFRYTPKTADLPRAPKLIIGKEEFGGGTEHNFNTKMEFVSGSFRFFIPAKDDAEISAKLKEASLMLENALNQVSAKDAVISSNIKSLNIVMK